MPAPLSALRERLRGIASAVGDTRQHVIDTHQALAAQIAELAASVEAIAAAQRAIEARQLEVLRSIAADEPWQRRALHELRARPEYEPAFTASDPLVSVVIPTHDTYALLGDRSIPSVLSQTYQHFEVIVVGDAAPAEAAAVVESFGDERLSFFNLPYRGPYPEDPVGQWHAGGVPPYNEGVRRARGKWIAPLNDDDAFRPNHLEVLLERAQADRLELVYGKVDVHRPDGTIVTVGGFPPALGRFTLQAAIYHAGLASIFPLELTDALFETPMDWGVGLRMTRAGVWMGALDAVVSDGYPSALWLDRAGASAP